MASLTETSENVKRFGCSLLIVLGLWVSVRTGWKIYRNVINPPQAKVVYGQFGKLPVLAIPNLKLETGSTPTYSLDTTTGTLPQNLPVSMPVYKLKAQVWTFLSEQRARDLAKKIGFKTEHEQVTSPTLFYWKNPDSKVDLRINTVTGQLTLETPLSLIEQKVKPGEAPPLETAKSQAVSFLRQHWEVPEDYQKGLQETLLTKVENGTLERADNPYEAELVRVDLFRKIELGDQKKKEYSILGPNPKEGLIQVMVAGTDFDIGSRIPRVKYTYWPINRDEESLYPLKDAQTAYQQLRDGRGYIVYLNPKNRNPYLAYTPLKITRILIRNVSIAYFDSEKQLKFLQPIYVFEGVAFTDKNEESEYVAYVPAVSAQYAEQ